MEVIAKYLPILFPYLLTFVFTLVITRNFLIAFLVAGAAYFIRTVSKSFAPISKAKTGGKLFGGGEGFVRFLLLLSAAVIKADGRIYKKERFLIRKKLEHDFGKAQTVKYMQLLEECLDKPVKIEAICQQIKNKLDYSSKIQLLHFLVGLTVTNGTMIDKEFNLLVKISHLIDIPERGFFSILAMFNFTRISDYSQSNTNSKTENKQKSQSKSRQRSSYRPSSMSTLDKAYQILEITASASDSEIKSAYRNLAKLHHPDKVSHLGPNFKKTAKIKFQKIAEAYDLIKERRRIK